MSNVTGPTSTLPGYRTSPPTKTMCDKHPDRSAVRRVQGETDSFGAEWYDLCQECTNEIDAHRAEARCGTCEWCDAEATDLRPRRDYDEGACGRVYDVCGKCVRRELDYFNELEQQYD